ncbi:hypothetical protein [Spirillospora albida]|uniref:hypothetical protein n=1 Tax=Spirillospora albida TaxID=58123 RepID=UPI0004C096BC|nr:hypothetical protein [Spirillospora albida]
MLIAAALLPALAPSHASAASHAAAAPAAAPACPAGEPWARAVRIRVPDGASGTRHGTVAGRSGAARRCPDPSIPLMDWPMAPEPRPITGLPVPLRPPAFGLRAAEAPGTAAEEPLEEAAPEPRPILADAEAPEPAAVAPLVLAMLAGAAVVPPVAVTVRRTARRRRPAP